ncbi:MAG: class I SAM-dependent methyltransferase, partial [Cohnella sp.]|nr:class I SAM-dependent methyltransferase [Cohnella sp.]
MIGGGEVDAISVDKDQRSIHATNSLFWDTKGNDVLGATALPFYGAYVTEDKCRLFGDVSGKKILEIGCGSGHSLQYLG